MDEIKIRSPNFVPQHEIVNIYDGIVPRIPDIVY